MRIPEKHSVLLLLFYCAILILIIVFVIQPLTFSLFFLQYASRVCSECFYKAISGKTRSFIAGQFTLQNSIY